jgi:F-type H+-transporting ATPase subunit delta
MSNALTLARPYARAAFELAKADQAAAEWSGKLSLAAQIAASDTVQSLISSPKLSAENRLSLFLPEGESTDSRYSRFLALLESNQRLALLGQIAELYELLRAEDERTLRVRVRTAMPIDPVQQQELTGALAARFKRVTTLDIVIDPELIGGAVVEAGDVVIDGSMRGKLQRLRTELAQ